MILFVVVTAAAWFWLGRVGDRVAWLTAAAPAHAIPGEALPLRVRVTGLESPSYLRVDLHWANRRDTSNGYLASGEAKWVGREGGAFDFEIMVQPTDGLRFVNGIIYLSPTGSWSNHTFAAATDLIPVTTIRDKGEPAMVRLPVHQLSEAGARRNSRSTVVGRVTTGILWLAASVLAGMAVRSRFNSRESLSRDNGQWKALAVAFLLAAGWELFGLEDRVGNHARAWAHAVDVYYPRALLQKGVISVTLAATLVFLGLGFRQRKPHQPLIFFGLYLAISVVNLLSFHWIDEYAGLSWQGVTLVEALKLLCAAAALKGVGKALGR